jgi:hypothetical protein
MSIRVPTISSSITTTTTSSMSVGSWTMHNNTFVRGMAKGEQRNKDKDNQRKKNVAAGGSIKADTS